MTAVEDSSGRVVIGLPSEIPIFKNRSTLLKEVAKTERDKLFPWGDSNLTSVMAGFSIGHWADNGPTSKKTAEKGYGIQPISHSIDASSRNGHVDCLACKFATEVNSHWKERETTFRYRRRILAEERI